MDDLWGNLEPVTGAASKRPGNFQDAPTKQPMKAGIKPAQQKALTGDQKKHRRQMGKKAATGDCPQCGGSGWIEDTTACSDPEHCDPLMACPACNADYHKPYPEEFMLPPTTSSSTQQDTTKESTMTTSPNGQPTEADLLTRMAAATTLTEQSALAAQLEDLRAAKREAAANESSLDWGAMDAPAAGMSTFASLSPVADRDLSGLSSDTFTEYIASQRLSGDSDWLMMEEASPVEDNVLTAQMRAQAAMWFEHEVWGPVKDSRQEFSVQAHNAASRAASGYASTQRTAAQSVFLDAVDHLYAKETGQRLAAWGEDPYEQGPSPTTDTYVSDGKTTKPVGVDPAKADTFDEDTLGGDGGEDPKSTTTTSQAPSLEEGSQPEGDSSEGPENPLTGDTSVDKSTFDVGNTEDKMKTQGGFFHKAPGGDGPMGSQSEWDNLAAQQRKLREQDEDADPKTSSLFTSAQQFFAEAVPSSNGLGEGIDEGDTPEGDHAESPVQNNGEGAKDMSAPTDSDRPGGGVNWGQSGGAAQDQTGAYTSSLSPNAQVFVNTLKTMASLDEERAGITGRQIAAYLAADATVPEVIREALKAGGNPFVSEAGFFHQKAPETFKPGDTVRSHHDTNSGRGTVKGVDPNTGKVTVTWHQDYGDEEGVDDAKHIRHADLSTQAVNPVAVDQPGWYIVAFGTPIGGPYESEEKAKSTLAANQSAFFGLRDAEVKHYDGTEPQNVQKAVGAKTAATPDWLRERVNDPYGTPNKSYDKDKGEYYDNPFWAEHQPEVVGRYKIINVDGLWYGYDTSQNLWTVGYPDKQSVLDIANGPRLDMWASRKQAGVPWPREQGAPAGYEGPAYYVVIGGTRTVLAGPFDTEQAAQAEIDSNAIMKSAYEVHYIENGEAPQYEFLPKKEGAKQAARDTGNCAQCGRAISYDSQDRKWTHDDGEDYGHAVKKASAKTSAVTAICEHCGRRIVEDEDGRWVDPEATGDDSIWRETCDANDVFDAVHEPKPGTESDDGDDSGLSFESSLLATIAANLPKVVAATDTFYGCPAIIESPTAHGYSEDGGMVVVTLPEGCEEMSMAPGSQFLHPADDPNISSARQNSL